MDIKCCFNYLCNACIKKYYTLLFEMYQSNTKSKVLKIKQEHCIMKTLNLHYCNFCYVIDNKDNLVKCDSLLCTNTFHLDCFYLVKRINNKNFSAEELFYKTIYDEISSSPGCSIKDDKAEKLANPRKQGSSIHEMNQILSKTYYNSFDFITTLYMINNSKLYKLLIKTLSKEMTNQGMLVSINESLSQMKYCQSHMCFNCFNPIEEFQKGTRFQIRPSVCCLRFHEECYSQKNDHLSLLVSDTALHYPLLHLKYFTKVYKYMKYFSEFKSLLISKSILPKNILALICKKSQNYDFLSIKSKKILKASYIEILSNLNVANFLKTRKPNSQIKVRAKCDCYSNLIKKYSIMKKSQKGKFELDEGFLTFLKENKCCNSTCINFQSKLECHEKICDCIPKFCSNRYKKSQYSNDLEIVKTYSIGYGLICKKNIKAGDFIIEYMGEIISKDEIISRERNKEIDGNWYIMSLENQFYLDGRTYGNKSRFINHSCDPNSVVEKWHSESKMIPRNLIFACKDIPAGKEITYHYNFSYFSKYECKPCFCGSDKCAKFIGSEGKIRRRNDQVF